MEFFMKKAREFCKGDDTCLFLILVLIGFIICMFFSRNEGFLDYAEFDGAKDGHDYNENLIGKTADGIGREPEQLGIQLQKNEPLNGRGPVISQKYEIAKRGKQYKPYYFNQNGGLQMIDSRVPTPWEGGHSDYYFVDGKVNQFGLDRPLDTMPSQGQAPMPKQQEPIVAPSGVPSGTNKKLTLVLFYAPWCGHSKNMLGDYDAVISSHHGSILNDVELEILKVDMEANPQGAKEYGVEVKGFPTLYTFTELGGKRMSKLFNFRKESEIIEELKNRTSQM